MIDLAVERGECVGRGKASPECVDPPLPVECADPRDGRVDRGMADSEESVGNVFRRPAIDFADEAQGKVKLAIFLPAGPADAVHQPKKLVADRPRRPGCDEQAMHDVRFRLKSPEFLPILWQAGAFHRVKE